MNSQTSAPSRPSAPKIPSLGLSVTLGLAIAVIVLLTIWLGVYRIDAGHVGIV